MMNSKDMCDAMLQKPERLSSRRPVKLQICLTPDERVQLAERARAAGYDTVSAFVRARTLGPAGKWRTAPTRRPHARP
jgi:hypothetical protein